MIRAGRRSIDLIVEVWLPAATESAANDNGVSSLETAFQPTAFSGNAVAGYHQNFLRSPKGDQQGRPRLKQVSPPGPARASGYPPENKW